MTRVDPPSPVHTRPYGPGRRAVILRFEHPLRNDEAAGLKARVAAAVPGLDVLFISRPVTLVYPPEATP